MGLPGGCNLGARPMDQHIKAFEILGATVEAEQGKIEVKAKELKGNSIYLDIVSVGATINAMLAAVLAERSFYNRKRCERATYSRPCKLLKQNGSKHNGGRNRQNKNTRSKRT